MIKKIIGSVLLVLMLGACAHDMKKIQTTRTETLDKDGKVTSRTTTGMPSALEPEVAQLISECQEYVSGAEEAKWNSIAGTDDAPWAVAMDSVTNSFLLMAGKEKPNVCKSPASFYDWMMAYDIARMDVAKGIVAAIPGVATATQWTIIGKEGLKTVRALFAEGGDTTTINAGGDAEMNYEKNVITNEQHQTALDEGQINGEQNAPGQTKGGDGGSSLGSDRCSASYVPTGLSDCLARADECPDYKNGVGTAIFSWNGGGVGGPNGSDCYGYFGSE